MIQPPTRQETVLVIEDDPTLRMGLRATLRSEGFRVIVANDGPSGLEAALSERPDLVLLDVMLPGMNGQRDRKKIAFVDFDWGRTIISLNLLG